MFDKFDFQCDKDVPINLPFHTTIVHRSTEHQFRDTSCERPGEEAKVSQIASTF